MIGLVFHITSEDMSATIGHKCNGTKRDAGLASAFTRMCRPRRPSLLRMPSHVIKDKGSGVENGSLLTLSDLTNMGVLGCSYLAY